MQAYRLTDEAKEDGFSGGTVNCSPAGHTFDVGKALEEGNGIIVTDDDIFAQVLAQYPVLERIPDDEIPEKAKPVEVPKEEAVAGATALPHISQMPPDVGAGEIPAEHVDEPSDIAGALAIGEAVSGTGSTGVATGGSSFTSSGSSFPLKSSTTDPEKD